MFAAQSLLRSTVRQLLLQAAFCHVCLAFVLDVGAPRSGIQSTYEAFKILKLNTLWSGFFTDLRWPWCEYLFGNASGVSGPPPIGNLTGWEAALDEPFHLIYDEVLKAKPDTKFVYTTSHPDDWYNQYLEFFESYGINDNVTIYDRRKYYPGHDHGINRQTALRGRLHQTRSHFFPKLPGHPLKGTPGARWDLDEPRFMCEAAHYWGCRFSDRELAHKPEVRQRCINGYLNHEKRVIRTIPKEQLLIFNISDGWAPLCDFLGKPVPDVPFPHVDRFKVVHNDSSDAESSVALVQQEAVRIRRREL
ncbi:unnamed protein product [Symbiodinium sp. CCMP2456]|nr:unnamed protein product [Symbiodinium sp. CCMP2456]